MSNTQSNTQIPNDNKRLTFDSAMSFEETLPTVANTYLRRNADNTAFNALAAQQVADDLVEQTFDFADGTTPVPYRHLLERAIPITAFGASSTKTAAQNMAALKAAIAATPTGGTLLIPRDPDGGIYMMDTTAGLTGAAIVDRRMTVIVDGHIKANYSAYEANPAYIFRVNANDVLFRGNGVVEGDGSFHVLGVTSLNFPGLVYVQGQRFSCRGLRFRRPPQTAFMVVADDADISGNVFEGGPTDWEASTIPPAYVVMNPAYVGSGHFHIVATGCSGFNFSFNRFLPDEAGGVVVNAIFTSGVAGNARYGRVIGNLCVNAWEKLLYGYGDRHVVVGNVVKAAYPFGYTDAIRVWGSYQIVSGNVVDGSRGGIQALDCVGCTIANNVLVNLRDSGINVQHFTSSAEGFTTQVAYNKVAGNLIRRDSASAEAKRFAIRLQGHADTHMFGCEVLDNIVVGWGDGESEYAIQLNAGTERQIQSSRCERNLVVSCASGIKATRFANGSISGNLFYNVPNIGVEVLGGNNIEVTGNLGSSMGSYTLSIGTGSDVPTNVRFTNNRMFGAANVAIRNFAFGSSTENWAEGNQWTAKALSVPVTLSAAATTTITHGGVAPHATIDLVATSDSFGGVNASNGLRALPNGANFDVRVCNGSAPAGGETGRAKIFQ